MQQKLKDILAVILISVVMVELLIYNSDINFIYTNVYVITVVNLLCFGVFIFWHTNKMGIRISLSLITLGVSFSLFFLRIYEGLVL